MVWPFLARSGASAAVSGLRWLFSKAAKHPVTVGVGSDVLLNDGKLSKKFAGAAIENVVGVDPTDWKTAGGLAITGLAIAGLSRQLLGDSIIGTIASIALGIGVAFLLKDQIKNAVIGVEELVHPESSSKKTWSGETNPLPAFVPDKPPGP